MTRPFCPCTHLKMCKFHLRGGYVTKEDDVVDEIRVSAPAGAVVPRYLIAWGVAGSARELILHERGDICKWAEVKAALTAAHQQIREVKQEREFQRQRADERVKAYERQSVELVELEEARQQAEQLLRESKRQQSDAWNDRVDAVLGTRPPPEEGTR